jgi:hypothetical protein
MAQAPAISDIRNLCKMMSRNELVALGNEDAYLHFTRVYWPRWFRNSMAQVIESVQKLDEPKDEESTNSLSALKAHLVLPNALCSDIGILEKKAACRLYSWFLRRSDKLAPLSPEILGVAGDIGDGPFSYTNADDIFASASGLLVPPLENALREVFKELQITTSYSTLRGSDIPLTLNAPNWELLDALRSRLPAKFKVFCSFRIVGSAEVRADGPREERTVPDETNLQPREL